MNRNTAGAILMIVLAAAGLAYDKPFAVASVAITCALAFLVEDFRDSPAMLPFVSPFALFCMALATWITTLTAMFTLVI